MHDHELTQEQLAARIGVERTYITKVLSGARKIRDVGRLVEIAQALQIPPERFGLLPVLGGTDVGKSDLGPEPADIERWRLVRRSLNGRRWELTKRAASLYPEAEPVAGTDLLTAKGWMPTRPLDLDAVELFWIPDSPEPQITGGEPETESCRPHGQAGRRYSRYSRVIRDLDRPSLFENRGSYRLLELSWGDTEGSQTYGWTTYFDMVDVCEAVSHELASVWLDHDGRADRIGLADLPFRGLIGDPFDLLRRPVLPSIDTLTIRYDPGGGSSFLLHRRSASNVAVAGGLSHVMPAGVFQPSGIAPWNVAGDFSLWRNMLREFSEEFLGNQEHDGSSGDPIDYDTEEPFRSLNEGRRTGSVRPWCLGVGLDPLTLAGEILTVVVIDAPVFDQVFADLVDVNSEGAVVAPEEGPVGLPWRRDVVFRLLATGSLAPAAAACVELTWKYRELITGDG
jgi:Helix-turn-helix.